MLVAVTAKKHFFLLWWKTLVKLPLLLKWLQQMHKHLNAYVTTTLSCKTPQSLAQQSKTKTSRKIYTTRSWELRPPLARHRSDMETTVVIQKLTDKTLPPTRTQEWMTNRHFSFQHKNHIHSKQDAIIAYSKKKFVSFDSGFCAASLYIDIVSLIHSCRQV